MSAMTWKERLSAVSYGKKLLVAVNAVLLIACAASALGLRAVSGGFETTTAARRFGGESGQRFAQIACYLPFGGGKSEEDIWSLREALQSKFVEQSLEAPEGGSLYIDAYSAAATVTVATDHAGAEVAAFGVGGDFFHFHPLPLRSGTYFSERDLMDDLVVLDETLAWRLFGGTELTGLTIHIGGKPFVVSGVISMEDDFAARRALAAEGTLFMSYSALKRLDEAVTIDCYEIVLPDPISGHARSTMESLLPVEEGTLVENSSRFSLLRLWDVVRSFGERSMRTGAVVYPYWENALRLAEDYAALLLVLTVLAALFPLATLVVLTVRGSIALWRWAASSAAARIAGAREQRRENRLARLAGEDTKGE